MQTRPLQIALFGGTRERLLCYDLRGPQSASGTSPKQSP